jgi:BirA family transcriptional regulator, biotin operon repressor / biotin---[acetyl-CoA-carboxylase] ligase
MIDPLPDPLTIALADLPLAEVRYFQSVDSTNTHCLGWAGEDAHDLSLAVADHQSAGRGRADRQWVTNPGAALAFSIILRPAGNETDCLPFFSPLGAVAIRAALDRLYGLQAEIKWPNDILVARRKLAGILVENLWDGGRLQAIIIGIGININPKALPPPASLLFPATCVETEVGQPVDRWQLLAGVLKALLAWRARLGTPGFFEEWSSHLAFRGERVCITDPLKPDLIGRMTGIDPGGDLLIITDDGISHAVTIGDVRLRAV